MLKKEIDDDLKRAQEALESAERNSKENDILTTANRAFVACENAVYVLMKLKFGSASISRIKILTKLKEISPEAKKAFDESYDLRVQADYGRKSRILPLNKENMDKILQKVKEIVEGANRLAEEKQNQDSIN